MVEAPVQPAAEVSIPPVPTDAELRQGITSNECPTFWTANVPASARPSRWPKPMLAG